MSYLGDEHGSMVQVEQLETRLKELEKDFDLLDVKLFVLNSNDPFDAMFRKHVINDQLRRFVESDEFEQLLPKDPDLAVAAPDQLQAFPLIEPPEDFKGDFDPDDPVFDKDVDVFKKIFDFKGNSAAIVEHFGGKDCPASIHRLLLYGMIKTQLRPRIVPTKTHKGVTMGTLRRCGCFPIYEDVEDELVDAVSFFVSHRWLTPEDPDPKQVQWKTLMTIGAYWGDDTPVFYDYTCMPQRTRHGKNEELFKKMLYSLDDLVAECTIVVLYEKTYVQRAWCVAELALCRTLPLEGAMHYSYAVRSAICSYVLNSSIAGLRTGAGPKMRKVDTMNSVLHLFRSTKVTSEKDWNVVFRIMFQELAKKMAANIEIRPSGVVIMRRDDVSGDELVDNVAMVQDKCQTIMDYVSGRYLTL